jgi:hypothetical protein
VDPEDAVLRKTTSWNTACVKNSEASANNFMRQAYSVSQKGGKNVFIMKKTLWTNKFTFVMDKRMIYVNFIITVIINSENITRDFSFVLPLGISLQKWR